MAATNTTDMYLTWKCYALDRHNDDLDLFACQKAMQGRPFAIFICVILALSIILVVALNSLGLVVLRRASGIQDTTKTFMASLTISDLCAGIFFGIPKLIETASVITPALRDILCVMVYYVGFLFLVNSILSLLLMTVDRYVAIVHSLRYPTLMTPRRSKVMVALPWAANFIIQAAFAITTEAQSTQLCRPWCNFRNYMFIGFVGISLGIVLVLYAHILKIARQQARRIAAQNHVVNPNGGQNARHRISTRSATTVIIVAGSAMLSWSYWIAVTLLFENNSISCAINYIGNILFLSNGWLNVIIYYWRNRELREAMRRMITSHRR